MGHLARAAVVSSLLAACYDPHPDPRPAPETVTASFAPTDAEWGNPERGFYYHVGSLIEPDAIFGHDDPSRRLVFAPTILSAFVDADIDATALAQLDANLGLLRERGLKAILYFAYASYEETMPDVTLERVIGHTRQLAPVLEANKDVLASFLGGFIGSGGSWQGSVLVSIDDKTAIRDALLAMIPQEIPVQILQIPIAQEIWWPEPLTAEQALARTPQARVGFNNPCMLSSDTDFSFLAGEGQTWPGFTTEKTQLERRDYLAAVSAYTPFGGETCQSDTEPARSQARLSCSGSVDGAGQPAGILVEGPRYHMTYTNPGHTIAFTDTWKAEGCFDEVARSLGYRFQLDAVSHPDRVRRGEAATFTIDLRNVGWGRIFSARQVVVTLTSASGSMQGRTTLDLRTLPPQATASTRLEATLDVPADASPGDYTVALSIPDVYPRSTSLQVVRFANADRLEDEQVWDEATGRFTTGTTVTVE